VPAAISIAAHSTRGRRDGQHLLRCKQQEQLRCRSRRWSEIRLLKKCSLTGKVMAFEI
jgi:hypothetical protein